MGVSEEFWCANFDNHDPKLVDDPYPVYAAMRERCHDDRG